MGGFQIPYYIQNPDDEPQPQQFGVPPPPPVEMNFPAAPEEDDNSPLAILKRLAQQKSAQQAVDAGMSAGQKYAEAFPGAEPDEDLQGYFAKLMTKTFGDQKRREAEMQRTPMDYARQYAEAYFGPEPTTKKGKFARTALQVLSGALGVQHPDFMKQGFEEWKQRQTQLQNEANTEQRLLMGQLQAVSAAKKNESLERQKNMGAQAQFVLQAMKSKMDEYKQAKAAADSLANQPTIEAKAAQMLADTTKKSLETSFMQQIGPMASMLKGQSFEAQMALLESLGDHEMAVTLANAMGLKEAAKGLSKSAGSQGSSSITYENVPVMSPDGSQVLGYRKVEKGGSMRVPNGAAANPQAAFNAMYQNVVGQQPPAAPVAQPQPQQQRQGFSVAGTPQNMQVKPAQQFSPQGDTPAGWVEIPTPHIPNISTVPRSEGSGIYGYMVPAPGAPSLSAFGKPPKPTQADKEKYEAQAAALGALGTKAKAAIDAYIDSPPTLTGGTLPWYERTLNRMKANAGTDMRYMFGSGDPKRVSEESIKSDQELFQRQQAENMATLLEEKALVGRRGGPAMADRVKTMFATNIMNPQMYILSAVGNSLMKNTAEKLRALGMGDYADPRLADYIAGVGGQVMKYAADAAQSPNPKAKEEARQTIYRLLDPERVLTGYFQKYYPGQNEFRVKSPSGDQWVMTIGKPGKKKKAETAAADAFFSAPQED